MLKATALRKAYGPAVVFDGVNLEVEAGEVVALLGDSGVGKSSLLNGLAGLDPLQGGEVLLNGHRVWAGNEHERALWRRREVGFVFQAFHVLPHLSVGLNVALPLMLLGMGQREQGQEVNDMLSRVGLKGFASREPRTLSGGQLQRVAVARALVHRPRLVLADEPTGNLDPEAAQQVMSLLASQSRATGAATVLVTHSMAAAQVADRRWRLTPSGLQAL